MKSEFTTPSKKPKKPVDPNQRIFVCGCGKQYKSYPALYTHIRQKHDGVKPEGTITHSNQKRKRRGRKRKQDYFDKKKEELQEGAMFGKLNLSSMGEEEKREPGSVLRDFKIEDFSFFQKPLYKGSCSYKTCLQFFASSSEEGTNPLQ